MLPEAVTIGALVWSTSVLWWLVALVVALTVGNVLAKRHGANIERLFYGGLLIGMVTARAAFVMQYWMAYQQTGWGILDVRDGGLNVWVALIVAWLWALFWGLRMPQIRTALCTCMALVTLAAITLPLMLKQKEQMLPEMAVTFLNGHGQMLSDLKGQPLVINLWATWCPPCRREMPEFERFAKQHPEVKVLMVNQGESAEVVRAFLQQAHLSEQHIVLDQHSAMGQWVEQTALPSTLFFDVTGRLHSVKVGEMSAATLQQQVQMLVPEK